MRSGRLEAFSDGVIAIIITIMVLELRVPDGVTFAALRPLVPNLAAYVLSFVLVAIYWNNHHHLLQVVERVSGGVLWANLHLLFWLSLVPVTTAWFGEHGGEPAPVATYGVVQLGAAVAWFVLSRMLVRTHGRDSRIALALGREAKGRLSTLAYMAAVPLAWVHPALSIALYVGVAVAWLVPDRRVSRLLTEG